MNLPITIQFSGDDDDDIDGSFHSVSSVEEKGTNKISRQDGSQSLAQTIVFHVCSRKKVS